VSSQAACWLAPRYGASRRRSRRPAAPPRVVALAETARTAADAAAALNCPLGAIVKSLVFVVGGQSVMALVAGDRRCDSGNLPELTGLDGKVSRADADAVRGATGYTIGGVPPLAHPSPLPTIIDTSLGRFASIKGNADARRLRREIALDMEPEEIADAQRLAREWMTTNTH